MVMKLVDTIRAARLQVILDAIDAGSSNGYMIFYSGPIPASADASLEVTNIDLGKVNFSDPAGSIVGDVFSFDTMTADGDATGTGTATFVRVYNSDDVAVMDMSVTTLDGDGAVRMNSVEFVEDAPFSVTSGTITAGGG